jgi:flagellar biosynthesis GTPase FlhF
MLTTIIDSSLPISFCGIGQRTPEDLEQADVASLCDRAVPEWLDVSGSKGMSRRASA